MERMSVNFLSCSSLELKVVGSTSGLHVLQPLPYTAKLHWPVDVFVVQDSERASRLGWRFNVVVASYDRRVKLLNVEPG